MGHHRECHQQIMRAMGLGAALGRVLLLLVLAWGPTLADEGSVGSGTLPPDALLGDEQKQGELTGLENTPEGGTLPGGTLPSETVPGGTLPSETFPNETVPGGTVPGGTVPGGTLPNETVPGGTLPSETVPGGTVPGGTLP
jgi:hypothetical protein